MRERIEAGSRGHVEEGWLSSRHTFSFGRYHDPARMGFGPLRVINEDRVAPGSGFPMHGHRDMEILTYVLDGALEHRDDLGHRSVIEAGGFQQMTAGRGVRHSEWNASSEDPVHLLQIWIEPSRAGLPPGHASWHPSAPPSAGRETIASGRPGGGNAPLPLHQDAALERIGLGPGDRLALAPEPGRRGFLHVVSGRLDLEDGAALASGDAVALSDEGLELHASERAEVLYFDLPGVADANRNGKEATT